MNETGFEQLAAAACRRRLTPGEKAQFEAWLALHPESHAQWQEELRLTHLLRQLPAPAVSSNFTSQVLCQVDAATAHAPRRPSLPWWRNLLSVRHGWQAAAAVFVGLLLFGAEYRRSATRAELRGMLASLPAAGLADVELWRDFDSIRNLPDGPLPSVNELAEALR